MAENNDSGRIPRIEYKSVLFIIQISNFTIITEQMPCSKKVKLKNIHFLVRKLLTNSFQSNFNYLPFEHVVLPLLMTLETRSFIKVKVKVSNLFFMGNNKGRKLEIPK